MKKPKFPRSKITFKAIKNIAQKLYGNTFKKATDNGNSSKNVTRSEFALFQTSSLLFQLF